MSGLDEIKKYKTLVESVIVESYEDRVRSVVTAVTSQFPTGIVKSKEDLLRSINNALEYLNIPQARSVTPLGKATNGKKEFIKDVVLALKGKIKIQKNNADPKVSVKDKILTLSKLIQDAVGDSFPDGDPIDAISMKASKHGLDTEFVTTQQNLDRAARLLGAKSYNDYLADIWDDVKGDNPDMPGLQDKNPWRD